MVLELKDSSWACFWHQMLVIIVQHMAAAYILEFDYTWLVNGAKTTTVCLFLLLSSTKVAKIKG